jgi:hypothetical protein
VYHRQELFKQSLARARIREALLQRADLGVEDVDLRWRVIANRKNRV